MDIVGRRWRLRGTPNREYKEISILLDVSQADPQAQVHLPASSTDHDGSAASTSEARKRKHYARPGHVSFNERSYTLAIWRRKALDASGLKVANVWTSWQQASWGEGSRADGERGW